MMQLLREDPLQLLLELLLRVPIVLIAISVHEAAHAYAAYRLGDPTARNFGRITLNPLKHFDPLGALCLLLFRFGWAKPVPINSRHFKKPRRDMALTALAGPMSNLLLGFLGAILIWISVSVYKALPSRSAFGSNLFEQLLRFLVSFMWINISFAIFNMLPIPPFDGSRFFYVFLPSRLYFGIMKYENYIMIAIFVLLWTGYLTLPLARIVSTIAFYMLKVFGLQYLLILM